MEKYDPVRLERSELPLVIAAFMKELIDGRGPHPHLELRRAGGGGVEIDGRSRFPRDQVEGDLMVWAEDRRHLVDRLVLGTVLRCVHADR